MKNSQHRVLSALLVVLFLSVAAWLALAQDVMKVGPDTHEVLLENDQVRVLKVSIKPGGTVPMHSHPANVAYFMSDARIKLTLPDGKTVERDLKSGAAVWNEPTAHAVENVGATELQEIQIELKGPAKTSAKN